MYKPFNVGMLPTNEKAVLCLSKSGNLQHLKDNASLNENNHFKGTYYNLYITSNDEIKEGDLYIHISNDITGKEYKTLNQCHKPHRKQDNDWFVDGMYSNQCHKIIATTDSSLTIYDGETLASASGFSLKTNPILLPQPSQQFIEYYVSEYNKGRIITEVMVEFEEDYDEHPELLDNPLETWEYLKINHDNTINIKSKATSFGDMTWYAENGTVYNNEDDLTTIVCFYNRDTGSYMNLPHDIAEKVAKMLNCR